jgi:hypothetical protein
MIYIGNLNKAEVLFALYCGSKVQGRSFLAAREELSLDACREIVDPWWTVLTKEDIQDKLVALAASGSDLAEKFLKQSNDIQIKEKKMFTTEEIQAQMKTRRLSRDERNILSENLSSLQPRNHAYSDDNGVCFYCGQPRHRHISCVVVVNGQREVRNLRRQK